MTHTDLCAATTLALINDHKALTAWVNEVLALPVSQPTVDVVGLVLATLVDAYEKHRAQPNTAPPADPAAAAWLALPRAAHEGMIWAAGLAASNGSPPDRTALHQRAGYLLAGLKGCTLRLSMAPKADPTPSTPAAPDNILKMAIVSMPDRASETVAERDANGDILNTKQLERDAA